MTVVKKHKRRTKKGRTSVKKHNRKVRKKMPTLYHVTKKEHVPSILHKGLFPQKPTSVFGKRSKDDPKAVYTFEDKPLRVQESMQAFKRPSESAFLRKRHREREKGIPFSHPSERAFLQISLSPEEFKERRLPPSYGARGVEVPLKGHIPPERIKVVGKEFEKKVFKTKAALGDYFEIAEGKTPKETVEIAKKMSVRGETALKEMFN